MDNKEEYHDPDYPEAPVCVKEEPPIESEEEKVEKIKEIIRREFSNELEIRENEVMLLDQRMTSSRRLLHRLRYAIVNSYYNELKLQITNGKIQDEIAGQRDPRAKAATSSLLREGQSNIHPSLKKLLGKKTADLSEIFKTRAPRNKTRKDYSAMLQKRNYTISADATKTLRPDRMGDDSEPCSSRPRKIPRHLEPKSRNVLTLDESTRNQMKHRYRIIIGNTSKYAPAESEADRSTHKWLLYVRGPQREPDVSPLVTAVTVRLHHSYAPHHTVHLTKPPFHITRRGWGEFPARVELHFALPQRNRPALVHHTIKLDTSCTGVQTLGAETLVDVWLYSTPEMLKYEYKEDLETFPLKEETQDTQRAIQTQVIEKIQPKIEPPEQEPFEDSYDAQTYCHTDNWLDFFSKEPKELDVDEMIIKPEKKIEETIDLDSLIEGNVISKCAEDCVVKCEPDWLQNYEDSSTEEVPKEILNQPTLPKKRIVKYIEPTTGKIYYLEMDRNLDLSTVQEIVINNTTAKISPIKSNGMKNPIKKKTGVSLLKPELKCLLKSENALKNEMRHTNLTHIENDHCYLATPMRGDESADVKVKKEKSLYEYLCSVMYRFQCIRAAVNFLLKKIPLISDQARDPDFVKYFPFVVESYEKYWKMDFAKRRNIEWSRAKLINRILSLHHPQADCVWRTKQIIVFSRLHGHHPIRNECLSQRADTNDWSSWNEVINIRQSETKIKQIYPKVTDITTLSIFRPEDYEMSELVSLSDSEDEIDVVEARSPPRVVKEAPKEEVLPILPVEDEDDRLRFLYVEKKCADIGIDLRCEDVGNGYFYSAVHAVLLSAMKCFAEELLRSALASKLTQDASEHAVPAIWAG
ncbi:hypothetical protein O3G_MSEX003339 [Manduca sexta]|nr:hypothetical protein O3G_MSEX003339 [Manduca sexta]